MNGGRESDREKGREREREREKGRKRYEKPAEDTVGREVAGKRVAGDDDSGAAA